jgi:hypothetical protein
LRIQRRLVVPLLLPPALSPAPLLEPLPLDTLPTPVRFFLFPLLPRVTPSRAMACPFGFSENQRISGVG